MADQTVRTIYEAVVSRAQRNLSDLAKTADTAASKADRLSAGLEKAGKTDVKPKIDLAIEDAEKAVRRLRDDLKKLEALDPEVQVQADVDKAKADLGQAEATLDALRGAKAELVVTADTGAAMGDLAKADSAAGALDGKDATINVTVDAGDAEAALDGMEDAAADAGEGAGDAAGQAILDGLNSIPIAGAVAGLVAAVGIGIGAGLNAGFEVGRMEDTFGARLGLDEATARKIGTAAGDAYMNAWGDSVEANLGTAQAALNNALVPSTATRGEIQGVIEQLTAVSEILGVDVTETAEAAGNMIKNGLAANATEAFDIIVNGSQEGLNRSEDWLDTLREYSSLFESLGLSGAEAGGLISQAMDEGARNSDVAADALKEFSIRAQDDSKATRAAFEDLGLDADEMGAKIAAGGETAKEGLDEVLDGLRSIEDPMARNAAGVALFGTMWEDMGNGASVLAMDLDGLSDSWINVGDTTETAMARMSDNAATSLDEVRRTIGNTLTQLAGGVASAWEQPIQDLTGWILGNRATILQYMLDVQSGFFDGARAAVEFGATVVEMAGSAAGGLDGIVRGLGVAVEAAGYLAGDNSLIKFGQDIQGAADGMETFSEEAGGMADTMRTDWIGAIDDAEARMGEWSGPALLRAQLDDAIYGMTERLDEFSAAVDGAGGTVTINGETLTAEEALNSLITEVDASDGTVTINGQSYPAGEALDALVGQIDSSGGTVTVSANKGPAQDTYRGLVSDINKSSGTVDVKAATGQAERDINHTARDRRMTITVGYSDPGFKGAGGSSRAGGGGGSSSGFAYGGVIPKGLALGGNVGDGYGIVPGPRAPYGVDNVLWPLASGGTTLQQPLAGGEMVVNPVSTAAWSSLLHAINGGLMPRDIRPSAPGPLIGSITMHQQAGESLDSQTQYLSGRLAMRFQI